MLVEWLSSLPQVSSAPLARTCGGPEITDALPAPDCILRRPLPRPRSSFPVAERASSGTFRAWRRLFVRAPKGHQRRAKKRRALASRAPVLPCCEEGERRCRTSSTFACSGTWSHRLPARTAPRTPEPRPSATSQNGRGRCASARCELRERPACLEALRDDAVAGEGDPGRSAPMARTFTESPAEASS